MKRPLVICEHCGGKGKHHLDIALWECLWLVSRASNGLSTLEIHKAVLKSNEIGPTAINNRMTNLLKLGLVMRRKRGKEYVWERQ